MRYGTGIRGRILDLDGNFVTDDFQVNDTNQSFNQWGSESATSESGTALVAWISEHELYTAQNPAGGSDTYNPGSIALRVMSADGSWASGERLVAVPVPDETGLSENFSAPRVTSIPGTDEFVVSWAVSDSHWSSETTPRVLPGYAHKIALQKFGSDGRVSLPTSIIRI